MGVFRQVYYFAYGSNLLIDRLHLRVGNITVHRPYKLYGYKLVFNAGHKFCSYANIIEAEPNDYVQGVLYKITSEQLDILNAVEILYEREIFVTDLNEICAVYVCSKDHNTTDALPTLDYVNIILQGYTNFGFHEAFNALNEYKARIFGIKKLKKFVKK